MPSICIIIANSSILLLSLRVTPQNVSHFEHFIFMAGRYFANHLLKIFPPVNVKRFGVTGKQKMEMAPAHCFKLLQFAIDALGWRERTDENK